LQLTSRVESLEFGSITRAIDTGTETVYLLKVTDIYGAEFRFLLGEPDDFTSEGENTAGYFFEEFMKAIYDG
jgi:hypothetical protein